MVPTGRQGGRKGALPLLSDTHDSHSLHGPFHPRRFAEIGGAWLGFVAGSFARESNPMPAGASAQEPRPLWINISS